MYVKTYTKNVLDRLELTIDWTDFLSINPDDVIDTMDHSIVPNEDSGVSIGTEDFAPQNNDGIVTVWLDGGIYGNSYVLTSTITTHSGRIETKEFRIYVV